MILLSTAIGIILFEAIGEGILKRFKPTCFIFDNWVQWVIAVFLFALWFIWAYHFCYVPIWKLLTGFVFVRFAIFDISYNLSNGQKWNYYGTVKWYDRMMYKLGSFGWFMKLVCLIIGTIFLLGYE